MPFPLTLRVTPEPDGAWHLALGHVGVRPETGRLSPAEVRSMLAEVRTILASRTEVVLVPGADAERTHLEERVGRALSHVLTASPALAASLAWQLGAAMERKEQVVIVVEAEEPDTRALPWELLAGLNGTLLEPAQDAVIARMAAGRPRPEGDEPSHLEMLVWCPTPDDAVADELLRLLDNIAERFGVSCVRVDENMSRARGSSGARVLHIVCHGRFVREQIELLTGEEGQAVAVDTAAHVLGPVLADTELVVLHVCDGGVATPRELEGLVGRFLAAGARACLAPTSRLGLEASHALIEGLYPVMVSGGALVEAVAAGRRAVRALALPHPDSRWHNQVLFVGDVRTLARASMVQRRWAPTGWPRPAPDAAKILDEASQLGRRLGSGFVGLEHLALALARVQASSPRIDRLRYQLGLRREEFHQYLSNFTPVPERAPDWRGTPRLRRYASRLNRGFDLRELWDTITRDRHHFLREMLQSRVITSYGDSTGTETEQSLSDWSLEFVSGQCVNALEVVGGPEDGRILRMQAGEVLGRWADGALCDFPLYQDTMLTDRRLSRRHVRWQGDGRVELLTPVKALVRGSRTEAVNQSVLQLEIGDVLQLTRATWLRAIVAEDELAAPELS